MDSRQAFSGGRDVLRELPPGLPMLFQFPRQKGNYKTAYVGTIPGEAVILQLPMTPGISQLLAESYSIVVRFVHDGQAYGYEARFVAAIRKPLPLFFVTFPHSVHHAKLRDCDRLAILERAVLTVDGVRHEGLMTDVSCGGCKIKIPASAAAQQLAAGVDGTVEFSMSMEERIPVSLKGTLVEVEAEGKKMKCRLAFHKDQDKELGLLAAFLHYIARLLKD